MLFLRAFVLVTLVAFSLQDNADEAIVSKFASGQRPLLALGLTPHHTVVIFGGPGGQKNINNFYVYQMPTSAFTPSAEHMFALSNGALVSKKWPAFFKALDARSDKFPHMVTVHDQVSEYVLAIFSYSSSQPVLYDLNKHQVVKTGFNSSIVQDLHGSTAIFSGWKPNSFYGFQSSKTSSLHLYRTYQFPNSIANSSSISLNGTFKVCAEKDNKTRNWIYHEDSSCATQNPVWDFETGFAFETRFCAIGPNVIVTFDTFDVNNTKRTVTFLNRTYFFSAGTETDDLKGESKSPSWIRIAIICVALLCVLFVLLTASGAAYWYFSKSSPPLTVTIKNTSGSRGRGDKQRATSSSQHSQAAKVQQESTLQNRSSRNGQASVASQRTLSRHSSSRVPVVERGNGNKTSSSSLVKHKRRRSTNRKHSTSRQSRHSRHSRTRSSTRASRKRRRTDATSFRTVRTRVSKTMQTKQALSKKLPKMVMCQKMGSKTAIHRPL